MSITSFYAYCLLFPLFSVEPDNDEELDEFIPGPVSDPTSDFDDSATRNTNGNEPETTAASIRDDGDRQHVDDGDESSSSIEELAPASAPPKYNNDDIGKL